MKKIKLLIDGKEVRLTGEEFSEVESFYDLISKAQLERKER